MKDLSPLLNPGSIAVVGASEKTGSFGGQILKNLVDFDYPGDIVGIHPKNTSVFGRPCVASLSALESPPEFVALAVANHQLLSLLEEAADVGARAAIVFGDPTVGAGRAPELQTEIAQLCERRGIVVCGPNAMGLYALSKRLVISGYPVDPSLATGNVALITHSGTVFDSLSQNDRDIGFNYVIAGGNEASINVSDYLHFVLDDPTTKAVALYLETVRDPGSFITALERAQQSRIPIIALKVGLSEKGKAMTQAHTGALAGGAEVYQALFERYGVSQVHTLDEMMDAIELFSCYQQIHGPRLSVLMESGGERSLLADIAEPLTVEFTSLSQTTVDALEGVLEDGVHPDNPLDAFGTGSDVVGVYGQCLQLMDADPATDVVVLAVDLCRDSYLSPMYVDAVLGVIDQIKKPLVVLVNLTAGANQRLMKRLREHHIPVLMGTDTALKSLHHLHRFSEHRPVAAQSLGRPDEETLSRHHQMLDDKSTPLGEFESKQLLASYGVRTTTEILVTTLEDAQSAANEIGFPVALKTADPNITHKSDVSGIELNIGDSPALSVAYQSMSRRLSPQVLVQEMVPPGVELIVGMKADPQFGPVLIVGLGGIFVEVMRDVAVCMPPIGRPDALQLLKRLKGYPLLEGVRGGAAANIERLVDQLLRFSTFVTDFGQYFSEIDINPIIVTADQTYVVDALMIPSKS